MPENDHVSCIGSRDSAVRSAVPTAQASAAADSPYGGRQIPRSVTMAVT